MPVHARQLTQAALAGLVAGLLSGVFGVGGGILMVPALILVLKMDQRIAHGTSLAAIIPIAVSGAVSYELEGQLDWPVAACLAFGAIAGAVIGTHYLKVLSQRVLAYTFSALLLVTAVKFLFDDGSGSGRVALTIAVVAGLIAGGAASGVTAGLLGVGGGAILVPVMVVGASMTTTSAKGTSLAVIVVTAVVGTWRNRSSGNVDLRIAAVAGLAGVASAHLGTVLSINMSEHLANVLFALLLGLIGLRMLWDQVSEDRVGHQSPT